MKKFLVALAVGGLMEQPQITYKDYQVIEAETPQESCKKYNEKNNCSYFKGACIGEYDENTKMVTVPITMFIKI